MLKNLTRALRLPFINASILPFIFGSLINRSHFNIMGFFLGVVIVAATHLGANLINDYADAKSGVDWQDKKFYGFFGGSKLIQEGILSPKFYLRAAVSCFIIAFLAVLILAVHLKNFSALLLFIIIVLLGISYSHKPLQLAYHRLGELAIFLLFGPALVMGGYFIQAKIFPDLKSFLLSLPFGLLTTAILFANEVPDYSDDSSFGKNNWVGLVGLRNSYILYLLLIVAAFISIVANIVMGYLSVIACVSFALLMFVLKAVSIIKKSYGDKVKLVVSSKLTIAVHMWVSIILIISIIRAG